MFNSPAREGFYLAGRAQGVVMSRQEELEAKIQSLNQTIAYLEEQIVSCKHDVDKMRSAQEEFVTMVSHELRTPITIIKECLSQLSDKLFGEINDDQDKLLQLAGQNIDRLTGCINQYVEKIRKNMGKDEFELL